MRSLAFLLLIFITFSSCSKNEETCTKAIENVQDLMMNSKNLKTMSNFDRRQIKRRFDEEKKDRIKACVNNFHEEVIKCVIKAKRLRDLDFCESKRK